MLRSARREIDIYERNRENLFSLRDGELRAKIHTTILRLTMPIDGIFDSSQAIDTLALQLKTPNLPDEDRQELAVRLAVVRDTRESSFEFIMDTATKELPETVAKLVRYTGASHDVINSVVNAR
jgi:hypothetical protein